jgi:hypothetical protein
VGSNPTTSAKYMKFEIALEYVTDVVKYTVWSTVKDPKNPTPEELIKVLKGEHEITSQSSIDHPEFTKLRESLGEQGYIRIERGWWNGDYVLKPFILNNKKFKKGDQFCCAAALRYDLKK